MERPRAKINADSVRMATDHAIHYGEETVRRAIEYLADDKRKERRAAGKCRLCFYVWVSRIGGAAITTQPCGVCGKEVMYGSTATDKLCPFCAVKHQLCKQCGADVELRPRRKYKEVVFDTALEALEFLGESQE